MRWPDCDCGCHAGRGERAARPNQWRFQMAEFPPSPEGIAVAHFIVSDDVERSRRFYTEVLGGRVAFSGPGGLTYVSLANCWIIINTGGGPTDDKPESRWRRHAIPTGSAASSISGSGT